MKKVYIVCLIRETRFKPGSVNYGKIQLNLLQVYETEDKNLAKTIMRAQILSSVGNKERYCIIEEYKLIE